MNLRVRLTVVIGAVAAIALAAVAYASYASARGEALAQIDDTLTERVALVGSLRELEHQFLDDLPDGMSPFEMGRQGPRQNREGFIRDDVVVQAFTTDGSLIVPPDGRAVLPIDAVDLAVAAGTSEAGPRDIEFDGVSYRMMTTPGPEPGIAVQLARDLTETEQFLADLRTRLWLIGLIGVAGIAVVAWFVAGRALEPVARLTSAAEHVAATTDLGTPIDIERDDEIGRLAAAFNRMLGALDTSRRQQERLVADAGHELRTPLTSLRTNIEVLAARGAQMSLRDRDELLADATYELEQFTALVSDLVELAGDSSGVDRPMTDVRLDEIVRQAAERTARRTGRAVEATTEPTTLRGRPDDLRRAVSNLLDNAHKWSPPGSPIEVVQRRGRVEVLDRGPGIPEADLERVFERFYRSDDARTRPGSGLGLAIVRQIATAHGGTAWAARHDAGGSAVGFEIPVIEEAGRTDPSPAPEG